MIQHVLQPSEVGLSLGGRDTLPACVAFQLGISPVGDVGRPVAHHEVGAEVGVLVARIAIRRFFDGVEVDAANGHVYRGQPIGAY